MKLQQCTLAAAMGLLVGAVQGSEVSETTSVKDSRGHFFIEEINVTARRKEEGIQEVPTAVTAFSQSELEARNISSVNELQRYVPGLSLWGANQDNPWLTIRGQGGYSPGSGPAVLSYLNEIPLPLSSDDGSSIGGPGLYFDLENLQVLKGPQGTLFGRSTTGGALLIQTQRPGDALGGYIKTGFGNYNSREVEAALNVPVIEDKLLVRIAGSYLDRDGYTKALVAPGQPGGRNLDNNNSKGARLSIAYTPTNYFRNHLIVSSTETNNHGASSILNAFNPSGYAAFLYPNLAGIFAQQQALGIRKQVAIDTDTFSRREYFSVTDIAEFDLTENITLKNIMSMSKVESEATWDIDGTGLPLFNFPSEIIEPTKVKQYTEEVQLQGVSFDSKLDWTVGLFYFKTPLQSFDERIIENMFGPAYMSQRRTEDVSKAIYAQGSYDISSVVEGLKITAGVRKTWDKRIGETRTLDVDGVCQAPAPAADTQCTLYGDAEYSASTWTLGLDYRISDDVLIYANLRRGYRAGGFNSTAQLEENRSFDPEYVNDIELGLKADWRLGNMPARTNIALFRDEYTDIQLGTTTQEDINGILGPVITLTKNAAEARLIGVEFEGNIKPTENVQLMASFSWLDFKYTDNETALVRDSYAETTFSLGGQYLLPLRAEIGDISLGTYYSRRGDSFFDPNTDDPLNRQKGYGLLSININWEGVYGSNLDLSAYVDNATDKEYAVAGNALYNFAGFSTAVYGAPRTMGVRLRYRFGAE